MVRYLAEAYDFAMEKVDAEGITDWPKQFVHADWHPGNMLFRDNHVVAVIDYDSARMLPRIIDMANGALQFSIIGGDEDVAKWPDYADESRFKRFVRGYDQVMLLSEAEVRVMPWLMVEALIAEAVLPIAVTGSFGRMEGVKFLEMVQKKVYWLSHSAERLAALVSS
jgi:homoserine kinase type II